MLLAAQAHAGAWGRDPGAAYLQLGWRHDASEATYDEQGTARDLADPAFLGDTLAPLVDSGRFDSDSLAAYGEVGVVPHVTVIGSLPLRWARTTWTLDTSLLSPVHHTNIGLGDAELGVRGSAPFGPVAGALTGTLRVPLYDNSPRALRQHAGNSDFFDDRVPLGPGTIDFDLLAALGSGARWGWAQLDLGLRYRDRLYSTVPLARLELGGRPWPWLAGLARISGQTFLPDGDQPDFFADGSGRGPLVVDRARMLTVSGGALVRPDPEQPWGGAIELSHVVAGQRAGRVTSIQLSLTWETP